MEPRPTQATKAVVCDWGHQEWGRVTGSASTVQEWGRFREVHNQQGAQWTQAYSQGRVQTGNMQAGLGGWGDGPSKAEVGAIGNLSREGRLGEGGRLLCFSVAL